MRKIVVTGGPYAGKTTLVEALRAEGCAVAPEAALQVIAALANELGPERARAWREEHPERFQVRIAELQLELAARAERSGPELVACDRGLLDGIATVNRLVGMSFAGRRRGAQSAAARYTG